MELVLSELAENQYNHLADYLEREFGEKTSAKQMDELYERMKLLTVFPQQSKHFAIRQGRQIRLLTTPHNYVFYTHNQATVFVLGIFDTRMSMKRIRQMVFGEWR